MSWFKCDFQMQTPGDNINWLRDDPAYIDGNSNEEGIIESVDMYLKRCHEEELEVIGITDHNFIGRHYLQKLIERNQIVAKELNRNPLTIFPGFEIEISQGNGVHFLCLFDPSTPLQIIDDIVTQLGLPSSRRVEANRILPSNKTFDELLSIVQEDPHHNGIVIAAHPLAESGILNNRFLTEHFQRYMLTDPRLLAIEIPRPFNALSPGWKKLLESGSDCHPDWRRNHPIATVMSSDCYSLYESTKGYIGKRYSWVRMSNFTIESLRQAMRDHHSRIRLQGESPDSSINFKRIKSLEIENVAFLENSTINFSPNFNCIIGGRGAGKSSVLEYIRLCTNFESSNTDLDNLKRIKNTLTPESKLKLTWIGLSGEDTFVYDLESESARVIRDEEVIDEETIFNKLGIQIYSQRQITNIANKTENLLPIIDQISGEEIKVLKDEEIRLIDEIRTYQQERIKLKRKLDERRALNQEIIELQKQWDSFVAVKEENKKRLKAQEIRMHLEQIQLTKDALIEKWKLQLNDIKESHVNLDLTEEDWEDAEFFNELDNSIHNAKVDLTAKIELALEEYSNKINQETIESESYSDIIESIEQADRDFIIACDREGLKPEELEILEGVNEEKNTKQRILNKLDDEILTLFESEKKLENLFDSLYEVWNKQTLVRKEKVENLLNSSPVPKLASSGQPFISVDITSMSDINDFFNHWNSIKVNRATRLGRDWDYVGEVIFNHHKQHQADFRSPWELLMHLGSIEENDFEELNNYFEQLKELLNTSQDWNELMLKRINDQIDITLYREDGTRAGSLLDNGLSDGQKNTAILTLLFADGTGPIIIDQPEDELDSDFIYNQLVPLIRNIKNKRQVIISSHNANLPVNGDADLIYALKTEMGQGILRQEGGLDQKDVRRAILDIMEGSEEAFRRRKEKYYS